MRGLTFGTILKYPPITLLQGCVLLSGGLGLASLYRIASSHPEISLKRRRNTSPYIEDYQSYKKLFETGNVKLTTSRAPIF